MRTPSILKSVWRLSLEAVKEWNADGAVSRGAAVAFYTIFSIAPLLLLVIALAGLFFSRDVAQAAVLAEVKGLMGAEAAGALDHILNAQKTRTGIRAAVHYNIISLGGAGALGQLIRG